MTPLLAFTLIAHVAIGIIALGALQLAFMQIIRRQPPWRIVVLACWTSLASLLLSWAFGAYYYVIHYGGAVKPRILEGPYPWAHKVIMEAKEHAFLLMPFLVMVALLAVYILRRAENPALKTATSVLLAVTLVLGALIAGAGVLISGAVR